MSTGKIGSTPNIPASSSTSDVSNVENSSTPSNAATPVASTQENQTGRNIAQQTAEATEAKGILDSAAGFLKETLRKALDSSPDKETKTSVFGPPSHLSGSPQLGTKSMKEMPGREMMKEMPGSHTPTPPVHPSGPPLHPNLPLELKHSSGSSQLGTKSMKEMPGREMMKEMPGDHIPTPPVHPPLPPITPPLHPPLPLDVTSSSGSPEPSTKTLVNDKPAVKLSDDKGK